MEQYYENSFKDLTSPIIVSRRNATAKNPGCLINMHEYIEFYYVLKGGVKVFCNGFTQWLYAGDIVFINWCQPHRSFCFLDDTLYYIVQFDLNGLTCGNADLFQSKFVSKLISDMNHFKHFFQNDAKMIEYFDSLIYEYENNFFTRELLIQSAICNILAHIIDSESENRAQLKHSHSTETAEYAKKIMQYLYVNYQNDVRIDDIAAYLGISSSYMCRVFKQYTGVTIVGYLNQLRCKNAISLMKDGYSMTQASAMVGYNDYTYFSRTFKKIYGVSPKELIKKKPRTIRDPF